MKTLAIIGPLPPPVHGVAFSTKFALANPVLRDQFRVVHIDTSDRRTIANLGRWDIRNIYLGLRAIASLASVVKSGRGLTYLPLSENRGGFARDSLFIWVSKIAGWKTAVHIRNCMFREFYSGQPWLMRWWVRRTMGAITGVAVLGESLRFLMSGFVDDHLVVVVPNGTPRFTAPVVEPDASLVLYLSNISRKKGADRAVRAALILAEADPDAHFVFAGGFESDEFESEVRALAEPLGTRLEFVGPVIGESKSRLMASARVLLFPIAWGEGHPRIVLESMAAGLPVVTTDRATIKETIVDDESGFVLDDPDPVAIAYCALNVLRDDALRERISAGARKRYETRFTQEQADEALAAWLTSLS